MFGYFRPYRASLTQAEQKLFEAHYCRLCYCLRIEGGQLARFFTTYDAAIYSIILALQTNDRPPHFPCERFGHKNMSFFRNDKTGIFFADLSIIAVGQKIRDDFIDGNNKKVRLINAVFGKIIKKTNQKQPELYKILYDGLERINKMQDENACVPDILSVYGDVAVSLISQLTTPTDDVAGLIKAFSEFNFFIDMVCDYDKDYRDGTYNGLKKEGLKTFCEYFNVYYSEFKTLYNEISDNLIKRLFAVEKSNKIWNTLYKIITDGTDRIVPDLIAGKDVEFHYFKDLFSRIRVNNSIKKDLKRLGVNKDEKD